MSDLAIFANMISARASAGDDFGVLTFVHFDSDNKLVEEIRSYQDLSFKNCGPVTPIET